MDPSLLVLLEERVFIVLFLKKSLQADVFEHESKIFPIGVVAFRFGARFPRVRAQASSVASLLAGSRSSHYSAGVEHLHSKQPANISK